MKREFSKRYTVTFYSIIGALILIGIIVSNISNGETVETAKTTETKETAKAEAKPKSEAKKKPTIKDVDLTNDALLPVLKDKIYSVDKVAVVNGDTVKVTFDSDKTYWDEKALVRNTALDGLTLMEALFSRSEVKTVEVITPTKMLDDKGNESIENVIKVTWNKSTSNEVNYKNFHDMMYVEFPRFYNEATTYYIHPAIYNKLDSEHIYMFENGYKK